jgi:hypothetical protein
LQILSENANLVNLTTMLHSFQGNRVKGKVRKTQHQNREFGHTQREIFRKLAKKYVIIPLGVKLRKPSILVVN